MIAIPQLGLEFKVIEISGYTAGPIAYVGRRILIVPSIIALGLATTSLYAQRNPGHADGGK